MQKETFSIEISVIRKINKINSRISWVYQEKVTIIKMNNNNNNQ